MSISQDIKVAVDAIVFGYEKNELFVLLVRQKLGVLKNTWCLPGGFVLNEETLTEAVTRELHEETGITVNYLEQLYTFGDDIHRDQRFRVISVAYFALIDPSKMILTTQTATDAESAQWFPIHALPELGFDHKKIIHTAFERLQSKLTYQPIGFDLLDDEFLFSDLENLYATILEKPLDRRNFRKKILSFGIIDETNKIAPSKSGRPARFFRFNKQKYHDLSTAGFFFEIKFA